MEELAAHPDWSCIEIIQEKDLWIVSDESVIKAIIDEVCGGNSKAIKAYKKGKKNQLEILRERVLKRLKNKSSHATVNQLLKSKLEE
ncbi:hypothetical protein Btru_015507 [Bulinus truncatus]|nr:hypothetical protein Btru_015507 [Bulinus truncatus]